MGMNLAAGLQAMGVDAAGHFAGRDKAPFRMMIGLPPAVSGATYLATESRRMWMKLGVFSLGSRFFWGKLVEIGGVCVFVWHLYYKLWVIFNKQKIEATSNLGPGFGFLILFWSAKSCVFFDFGL